MLTDFEARGLVIDGRWFNRHGIDAREARTALEPCDELVDRRVIAVRKDFDAAVGKIGRVAGHAKAACLCLRRAAEPDTLHAARDAAADRSHVRSR